MNPPIRFLFPLLLLIAVWLWIRDLRWYTQSPDTLAILCVFPLAWWIGGPFRWKSEPDPLPLFWLCLGFTGIVLGLAGNILFLAAVGWGVALTVLAKSQLQATGIPFHRQAFLWILGFPWVVLDFNALGWWFRLSGAMVTEFLFGVMGFAVLREGTFVTIEGFPISIEAACSGLNLLQALLIGGVILALFYLRKETPFWMGILLLPLFTWVANTLRILMITAVGLSFGIEVASGLFHTWGALLVVALMVGLTALCFQGLESHTGGASGA